MLTDTIESSSGLQKAIRITLGSFLAMAGISHLTFARQEFTAQVPPWLPLNTDLVVILSGIVEMGLGAALLLLVNKRVAVGWIVALFFVLIFPGNIAQLTEHRDAFGLDTDLKRWLRLPFQLVLIGAALWSTGAWQAWRNKRRMQSIESIADSLPQL